jgi:hypothetical protein
MKVDGKKTRCRFCMKNRLKQLNTVTLRIDAVTFGKLDRNDANRQIERCFEFFSLPVESFPAEYLPLVMERKLRRKEAW